jgi:serine/threonine protein kinase
LSASTDGETAGVDGAGPRAETFPEARGVKGELLAELRASWEAGRPVVPEELLGCSPGAGGGGPEVASLLPEDFLQRSPPPPPHEGSLGSLSARQEAWRGLGPSPGAGLRLLEPGASLFGFTLRRELGRGAFARVFLAEQANLAGRPVAIKVSAIEGSEPQTLAQLQHTHIVPVYSVHEDARAGLRALCMPYFGGASLSQVLGALREATACPARGEQLVRALDAVASPLPEGRPPAEVGAPFAPRALLSRLSYVQAGAWLVARLAEGLAHAHQRGVLHRDVKPSNILLGGDGQPMLLDFNLSQSEAGAQAHPSLGGTVAYMSPEHLRALAARDPALAGAVDQRSDIYSLGMVLFEMLAGHRPFDQSASYSPLPVLIEAMAVERGRTTPSLRAVRPDVPWGLDSILRKCLEPLPAWRYQQAEQLAEDLRRFLDDRPLRHAPEPSRVERARKWLRRHPRLASSGTVSAAAALLLFGAGLALAAVLSAQARAQDQLRAAQAQERQRAFEKGVARALFLVNTTNELEDHLRQGVAVCEEALGLYGVLDRPDWQEHPEWRRLAEGDRRRLAEDARELLLLLAGARVRLAPGDRPTLAAALGLLDKAEAITGLTPAGPSGQTGRLTARGWRTTRRRAVPSRRPEGSSPAAPATSTCWP